MIINWTKKNPNTIPFAFDKGGGGVVRLLYGHNAVDDNEWEAAKKNLTPNDYQFYEEISDMIDVKKEIEVEKVVDGKKTKVKGSKKVKKKVIEKVSSGLIKFKPEEANKMILDCFNTGTLKSWLKKETRDEVRADIKNQLDLILEKPVQNQKKFHISSKPTYFLWSC